MTREIAVGVIAAVALAGACGRTAHPSERSADAGGAAGEEGLAAVAGGTQEPAGAGGAVTEPVGGAATEDGGMDSQGGVSGDGAQGRTGTKVQGVVRAGRAPLAGVIVAIDGVVVVSDADGRFTIDDVAESYELSLVDSAHSLAMVWSGLTTREPHANVGVRPGEHAATVSGTVSGGAGIPNPQDHHVQLVYESLAAAHPWNADDLMLADGSDSFEVPASWNGQARDAGQLLALQWHSYGNVTTFTGYATETATLQAGKTSSHKALVLEPPPLEHVETTIDLPDEYELDYLQLELGLFRVPLDVERWVSLDAPRVGLPLRVAAWASREDDYVGATLEGPPRFMELPAPPRLLYPKKGATNVAADAAFSWSMPQADLVPCARWRVAGWLIIRCQPRSLLTTKFPELTDFGVPPLAGNSGTWQVIGFGPNRSVDEFQRRADDYEASVSVDWRYAVAAQWEFTTAAAFTLE